MVTFQKIYNIVALIPPGKVTTYKDISNILGINPRIVGYALHANKNPLKIPCHRVVKADGSVANGYAFGGKKVQVRKLKLEKVVFLNENVVDLKTSLFNI